MPYKQGVIGSSPVLSTSVGHFDQHVLWGIISMVDGLLCKQEVAGSSPVCSTNVSAALRWLTATGFFHGNPPEGYKPLASPTPARCPPRGFESREFLTVLRGAIPCGYGGMADAADLKSATGSCVWVRVPLSAPFCGVMAERLKALVLKTSDTERYRGFESLSLRCSVPLL